MTVPDLGGSPRRRLLGQILIGLLLVFALSVAATLPKILRDRKVAIAEAQAWTITGPRCQSVTETEFRASPHKAETRFVYANVQFARAHGHVSCAEIRYDDGKALFGAFPVCQFTRPAVIEVRSQDGAFYFLTGVGQRATVSAPHGRIECVLAGNFRG